VQNIKSGLMEIADAFIINKADRDGADFFINNLKKLAGEKHKEIAVFKTIASESNGIDAVTGFITTEKPYLHTRKELLLTEKAYNLIRQKRMTDIDKHKLQQNIAQLCIKNDFNLYSFVDGFVS
jgi:LAO/AO transport system kinase